MTDLPLLRQSERASFKRCQWQWNTIWNEGWQGKDTAKALWFGEGFHLVMAHIYKGPGLKRGRTPLKVWREFVNDESVTIRVKGLEAEPDAWVDAKALGEAMITNYLDHYGKDATVHVIGPEHRFQLTLRDEEGEPLAIVVGTYDLVFRDLASPTEALWLMEHKTAATISTNHLPLDPQGGTYWTTAASDLRAKKLIGPRDKLEGVMYNFSRKAHKDEREQNADGHYLNKNGEVSKRQPSPLFHREPVIRTAKERQATVAHMRDEVAQMNLIRDGTMKPTKVLNRECHFCPVYGGCLLDEQTDDFPIWRDSMMRQRDPYADHRKSTEGWD